MNGIGERLKSLRSKRGLKQQDIADALGIQRGSYGNYENDTRVPNLDQIIKLAELFEVSLDFLVKGEYYETAFDIQDSTVRMIPLVRNADEALRIGSNTCSLEAAILPTDEADKYFNYIITEKHMTGSRIGIGDKVLVYRQSSIDVSEIGILLIDDKHIVVGTVQEISDTTVVMPINTSFKPLLFNNKTREQLKVLGKVISGYYDLKSVETSNLDVYMKDHAPKEFVEHDPIAERLDSIFNQL